MKFLIFVISILYYCHLVRAGKPQYRLVCYYDAVSEGPGKQDFQQKLILKALSNCTHLIYTSAQIVTQNFEIHEIPLSPKPGDLKTQFPHLKVFLSLGGDNPELTPQYLEFLEGDRDKQRNFTQNISKFLKHKEFDGLDLAFPFPRNKPRKAHAEFDAKFKNFSSGEQIEKANVSQNKKQYTEFVKEMKDVFTKKNLRLSMTVLPNVNSTFYFDINKIYKNFDFINLFAFDFITPNRNPQEPDHFAPIYFRNGTNRLPYYNIEYQVNHWIYNGCPVNKLNLGIATYGRAWKLTSQSGVTGKPVVKNTNGPAAMGNITQIAGLLSLPEICLKLKTKNTLHKIEPTSGGNYVFRPNDIWISFDDPQFAAVKVAYAKHRGMGGVAIYKLNYDDYQQVCKGPAFPLLSSVSEELAIFPKVHKYEDFGVLAQ